MNTWIVQKIGHMVVYLMGMKRMEKVILAIDLKSFYASVECLNRDMDPFSTPLVVADESRGDGTIVLAASPFIKEKYHVSSRCRLSEVPKDIPGLIIAMPSMRNYLEMSSRINSIYLDYVSKEDMFIYSIDESFLDCTKYLKRGNDTPMSYAKKIIEDIRHRTGLTVTAGIGKNMFMAKACMDIDAKHTPSFVAQWDYADIPNRLWNITPLSRMWGIGQRLEKKLNDMGFFYVGDIACSDPGFLKSRLGVIGEEIYYHSLGYDDALLQDAYVSDSHSLSVGQVLLRDYYPSEMPILIDDMALEISDRLYMENLRAKEFVVYYADKSHHGFSNRILFDVPTDSAEKISSEARKKYLEMDEKYDLDGILFRQIGIVALNVRKEGGYQTSLFEDYEGDCRIRNLEKTLLQIRMKYGPNKAMHCVSSSLSSTFLTRSNQIGGHHV
jgi:DNA polymerase V